MAQPIKLYSQALAEVLLKETDEKKQEFFVLNMIRLLKKNRSFKDAPKVIDLAKKLLAKKLGGKKITFETARKLTEKDRGELFRTLSKKDFVEERLNPEIIAGIKIIINDEYQLDNSILKKIKKIFK